MPSKIHRRDKNRTSSQSKKNKPRSSPSSAHADSSKNARTHLRTTTKWNNGLFLFILTNVISMTYVWMFLYKDLPKPKSSDISWSEFSEERAMNHVYKLASFGIRTVGSYSNEVLTPNYIIDYMESINHTMTHTNAHKNPNKMEIMQQKASGTFVLEAFMGGFVNTYENISNVLIRISNPSKPETLSNAILINAHYDSALGCTGINDDGISIAILMELARNIMSLQESLNCAVILNLNGGEETILQAAHGFITAHEWAKTVKMFINLEASGAGGQEILFQAGPGHGWLIDAYKRAAKYPRAQSIANELFETGVIPSLTDFTIYRSYGGQFIPGIDFAFADNGFVYHTSKDSVDNVDTGSLQHCGDNILGIVETLNSDLNNENSHFSKYLSNDIASFDAVESHVFFDVFGWFMVSYAQTYAIIFHIVLCILFILQIKYQNRLQFDIIFQYSLRITIVNALAMVSSAIIGCIHFYFIFLRMKWYSYPFMTVPLFAIPCIITIIAIHDKLDNNDKTKRRSISSKLSPFQLQLYLITANAFLCFLVLFLISLFRVGLSAVSLFWCLSFLVILFLFSFRFGDLVYCLVFLLPLTISHFLLRTIIDIFVPIMGRSGTDVPADIVVSVIVSFVTCIVMGSGTHFIYRLSSLTRKYIILLLLFSLVVLLSVNALLIKRNYTSQSPKRVFIQTIYRKFNNASLDDSGLWVLTLDSMAAEPLKGIGIDVFDKQEYIKHDMYHFPWFAPVDEMVSKSFYIRTSGSDIRSSAKADKLMIPERYQTRVEVINQTVTDDGEKLTYFSMVGPSHFTMCIDTHFVSDWSLDVPVFTSKDEFTFIYMASGASKIIRIENEIDSHLSLFDKKSVRSEKIFWLKTKNNNAFSFAITGHHINGDYIRDPKQQVDVLQKDIMPFIPDWIELIHWTSEWHEIVI